LIVTFPMKNGDLPLFFVCLPEGTSSQSIYGKRICFFLWIELINEYKWWFCDNNHGVILSNV
jgi:hypothetical protein